MNYNGSCKYAIIFWWYLHYSEGKGNVGSQPHLLRLRLEYELCDSTYDIVLRVIVEGLSKNSKYPQPKFTML